MLFLDQTIQRQDIESDAFRAEVGKLKSLEETEKNDLKKCKKELTEQLATVTAELESLKTAQAELITRAKADSLAEYLGSAAFKTRVDHSAECIVEEYRTSPALGKIFVTLITFVRSMGFTEGVDCLKNLVPNFSLDQLPVEVRSFYDPSAGTQVESAIREHRIYTSFEDETAADQATAYEQAMDQLSNSKSTCPAYLFFATASVKETVCFVYLANPCFV